MKQKSLAVQHPEDETQPFVWSACWALWRQNGPEAAWMPQQLLSVCLLSLQVIFPLPKIAFSLTHLLNSYLAY